MLLKMKKRLSNFFQRTNVKIYLFHFIFSGFYIKMSLQSKPEFGRVTKEKRKPKSSIYGNRAFSFEYLANSNGGNFDFPRKNSSSNSIRSQKFLAKNFSRVNRWNFFHNTYLDFFSDSLQFQLGGHSHFPNGNISATDRSRKYYIAPFYLQSKNEADCLGEILNPLHLLLHQLAEAFDTLIFAKKQEIFWNRICSIFFWFPYRRKIVSLPQNIVTRYFSQAKQFDFLHGYTSKMLENKLSKMNTYKTQINNKEDILRLSPRSSIEINKHLRIFKNNLCKRLF